MAVVDSNVLSWNISIPLPGNDDSVLCLNYYCFLVSRSILYSKGLTM
jgi:ribosomal protein S2